VKRYGLENDGMGGESYKQLLSLLTKVRDVMDHSFAMCCNL